MKKITCPHSPALLLFLMVQFLMIAATASAFQQGPGSAGCAAGECRDCHSLERKEVAALLKAKEGDILSIGLSEVPGLWEVEIAQSGKTFPLLIDFSKEFLVQGQVFRLKPPGEAKKGPQPAKVIDISKIPLDDALLIGKADATRKIIVFDDPECQFCSALQPEMQATVKAHPEVAFLIKLFPLTKIHPTAYEKARAIVCAKSVAMLEDSLAGKPVPAPLCDTDQIKNNLELGKSLGVFSTPTMIMPDGRVVPGSKSADDIFRVLNGEEPKGEPKKEAKAETKVKPKTETKVEAKVEAKKTK
ncbi:MAG: DsbC family protein [Desulfobulbaceae bacterium]|nr:DsbC family protein [Desulfobulbaceae bacterium]